MRGHVDGLATPHPLAERLPALLQQDDLACRFVGGLDDVLAPVVSTLDNLDAYLDPALAPGDFTAWLAGWVGLTLDENWPPARRRALVAGAVELYRWRGTRRGLAEHVRIYTGVTPEVEDSGGAAWSPVPGGEPPGRPEPEVTVRVRVADPEQVDRGRLDRLVAAAKPAHVAHRVEVVAR